MSGWRGLEKMPRIVDGVVFASLEAITFGDTPVGAVARWGERGDVEEILQGGIHTSGVDFAFVELGEVQVAEAAVEKGIGVLGIQRDGAVEGRQRIRVLAGRDEQ